MTPAARPYCPSLTPDERKSRADDYADCVHLPEPQRWAELARRWGVNPKTAKEWCRWNGLYLTEADRQQAGRIESRRELWLWWCKVRGFAPDRGQRP